MHLDQQVKDIMELKDSEAIDSLIHQYTPFVISSVSECLGRYLSVENDEALSVGLSAFYEAMERYEREKGHFLSFAKLVIKSRLKNFMGSQASRRQMVEWDEQQHSSIVVPDQVLKLEIEEFEVVLGRFGLDFDVLTEQSPKHQDTRERANRIAYATSRVAVFVSHIYDKRRLPIVRMAERFFVSVKIIKRSKAYILASVVIWTEKFLRLQEWIRPEKVPNFE